MNDDTSKRRLGRSLAALIGEMDQPVPAEGGAAYGQRRPDDPIEFVTRNPRNPRRFFDDTASFMTLRVRSASMGSCSQSSPERSRGTAMKS